MSVAPDKQSPVESETSQESPDRRYRRPPVIEALCELLFADSEWDDTIPGSFYERVKKDFPDKKQRRIQEAQIRVGQEQAEAGIRQLPPWMQFVSQEKHRMIQLAQNLLVVNQLAPYPRFEEWEPDIHRALKVYQELAEPKKVVRLGLRYINRVVIPGQRVPMEEYFTVYPKLPKGLGDTHGAFLVRVEIPQAESGHTVLITFGTAPHPPSEPSHAFTLDLYDTLEMDAPVDEEAINKAIRCAHDNIVLAFEHSITDKLRALFEPEEQA